MPHGTQTRMARPGAGRDPGAGPCPSSTRTTTSGWRAASAATCSTTCGPTPAPATGWSGPSSWSAASSTCGRGPEAMRPVGETRFVAGLAARTAAGPEGAARVGAIVGPRRPAAGRRRGGGPPRPPGGQPPVPRHPPRRQLGPGAEPLGAGGRPLPGPRLPRGLRQARPARSELRTPGSTTRRSRTWRTWPGPSPGPPSSSTISAAPWGPAPTRVAATRSSRSGAATWRA